MNESKRTGFYIFVFLILIVATILGTTALVWQSQVAKARQLEARAQIAEAQPDIIVARSQANINNAVALGTLKDAGLIIVLVIVIVKDLVHANVQSNNITDYNTQRG